MKPLSDLSLLLHDTPDAVRDAMVESLGKLVGKSVESEQVFLRTASGQELFGSGEFIRFNLESPEGEPLAAALFLDLEAAVRLGAAFSLMGEAQVEEALAGGEIPENLSDAASEAANILVGSLTALVREKSPDAPDLRRSASSERFAAGPWPDLLARVSTELPWNLFATRLSSEGRSYGRLVVVASDGESGDFQATIDPLEQAAQALAMEHIEVAVGAKELDPNLETLLASVAEFGVTARQEPWSPGADLPDLLFLPADDPDLMRAHAEAALTPSKPGPIVVAVSTAPTQSMVLAARDIGIATFLVLPAELGRLEALLDEVVRRPLPARAAEEVAVPA